MREVFIRVPESILIARYQALRGLMALVAARLLDAHPVVVRFVLTMQYQVRILDAQLKTGRLVQNMVVLVLLLD
jgi:hypothetical protein